MQTKRPDNLGGAMREIKFRAWDEDIGVMIYFGLGEDNLGVLSPKDGRFYHLQISDATAIMQFTGLRDRTGKEIYEGDIWRRGDFIGEVVFEYSGWNFKKTPSSKVYQYPYFYSNADSGEVIGNIYEGTRAPHRNAEKPEGIS